MNAPFFTSDQSQELGVKAFYKGKNILLTGVTGFLGKAVLFKIFKSLRNVNKVYILVRKKKNTNVQERVNELFNTRCFDVIK